MIPRCGWALAALVAIAPHVDAQSTSSAPAPAALTLAEVVQLRRSGVPTPQILQSAREYCVAFVVADSAERELRAAGADSTLLMGLRSACRPDRGGSAAPVAVLLEDDFKTTRRLPVSALRSQGCRSRYDVDGYYLASEDTQLGCTVSYPSVELSGDFRIDLNVVVLNGPDATVALGFWRDRYTSDRWSFNVQANGRFELCRFEGTHCTRVLPASSASSASTAWRRSARADNTLAVEVRGRALRLYINDTVVAESVLQSDPTGLLVLGVGPRSSAVFRSLRVTRPIG